MFIFLYVRERNVHFSYRGRRYGDLKKIKKNEMHIYIYFHICTIGSWFLLVKNCFQRIIRTGLINKVRKIFLTVLGDDIEVVKRIFNHEKVDILFISQNINIYERMCLETLHTHARNEKDFKVLYLHSKGVTKGNNNSVLDWIELLTYFTVDLHNECLELLNTYDTCGVNLQRYEGILYYSGNFWWANSNYIKSLSPKIGSGYIDPELWIGRTMNKKQRMVSLWNSDIDHYHTDYSLQNYIGQVKIIDSDAVN